MDNYFDHIEAYLQGKLALEDKIVFESELEINEQLAFAVEEYDLLKGAQDVLIEEDIQASIHQVQAELNQGSKTTQENSQNAKGRWLKPLGIAALVILLLGIGYLVMQGFEGPQTDMTNYAMTGEILREKYFREPVNPVVRGATDTVSEMDNASSPQKPCEIAHHLMANKQYQEALHTFSYSLNDTDQLCKWKSEFYTALILAIQGDTDQSKRLLDKIVKNQDHGFQAKAQALLTDLD